MAALALFKHTRELVHGDHIVIPGVLVRLGSGGAGHEVVELSAQHQRPGIIQTLRRVGGPPSQAAATEARSAASASSSFLRFQRLCSASEVSEPAE